MCRILLFLVIVGLARSASLKTRGSEDSVAAKQFDASPDAGQWSEFQEGEYFEEFEEPSMPLPPLTLPGPAPDYNIYDPAAGMPDMPPSTLPWTPILTFTHPGGMYSSRKIRPPRPLQRIGQRHAPYYPRERMLPYQLSLDQDRVWLPITTTPYVSMNPYQDYHGTSVGYVDDYPYYHGIPHHQVPLYYYAPYPSHPTPEHEEEAAVQMKAIAKD